MTARANSRRLRNNAQRGQSLRVQRLVRRFPSAACDSSGDVWNEEVTIIKRMMLGQKLVCSRSYLEAEDNYAVSWYWSVEPVPEHRRAQLSVKAWNRGCGAWSRRWYPRQWDGPVMRLIGREILRPVTCAGGYTTMEFTNRAVRVLGAPNAQRSDASEAFAAAPGSSVRSTTYKQSEEK